MLHFTCDCGCMVQGSTEDEVLSKAFKHMKDAHFEMAGNILKENGAKISGQAKIAMPQG